MPGRAEGEVLLDLKFGGVLAVILGTERVASYGRNRFRKVGVWEGGEGLEVGTFPIGQLSWLNDDMRFFIMKRSVRRD